jgi:hypothetical protein
MYDHILVVGNGKTSRANVEALVDDYIHANPTVKFTLYSVVKLSEGQIWLKQYLEDKEVAYEVTLGGVPELPGDNAAMFILWDDEDPESANCLASAKEMNIPAFDLTEGLVELNAVDGLAVKEAPVLPAHDNLDDEEEDEYDEEIESLFSDDVIVGEALLLAAVNVIANAIAVAVAKELKKVIKK